MQGLIVALAASAVSFAVLYLMLTRRVRVLVDPERVLSQIRREIEELIAELNGTTERNISLLEQKVKTLSGVLQRVDKRIAVLKREAAALEQSERVYAALRMPPAADGTPPSASAPVPPPAVAVTGVEEPDSGDEATEGGGEHAGGDEGMRARIVSLHRAGISPESIARRVKLPRAKVELIVALEEEGQQ